MDRDTAIMNAWEQIQGYCKENYAGRVGTGIKIEYQYCNEFGLTSDGEPYIVTHMSGGKWYDYYHHPVKPDAYERNLIPVTEECIQHWPKIKKELRMRVDDIYNFQV